jgi:hypothetical protein
MSAYRRYPARFLRPPTLVIAALALGSAACGGPPSVEAPGAASAVGNTAGATAQGLAITNARILDGNGGVTESGTVVVRDGKIVTVASGAADAAGALVIDAAGRTVMPGFIDAHRHLRRLAMLWCALARSRDLPSRPTHGP